MITRKAFLTLVAMLTLLSAATLILAATSGPTAHHVGLAGLVLTSALACSLYIGEAAPSTSERRMGALLEAAVDAIISINDRGIIQTTNAAACRMFGYEEGELIGQNVAVLMPAPHRDDHDGYLARYLTTGEKKIIGVGREVVARRKDGTTFPAELSVAEARPNGERTFVGIVRDLTERKLTEEALEGAVAALQAKNEEMKSTAQQLWQAAKLASVGELAASIAHELNNPLATVTLRLESVLARTPADDPRRRPLEIIEQEVRRMADLVANLLQFCRRGVEECSTVDVRHEVGKAVDLIQHHLQTREVIVARQLNPATPVIYADRQKLRQVFLNLLTNAADAMPHGGTLTLRTAPATLGAGTPAVMVELTDTGVGIPAEHLDKVIEPFFTTKPEGKGTGLGLAICRRIVQEHRGKMELLSEVGKGTTVRLTLPITTQTNVAHLGQTNDRG